MCQVSRQPGDWYEEVEQDMKGVDFQSSGLLQGTLFWELLLQMLEVELPPGKSLITAMLG